MQVRRLSWAGIEICAEGQRLLIDPLEHVSSFQELLGVPLWPVVPVTSASLGTNAIITHKHLDHFDVELLRHIVKEDGRVYCPEGIAQDVRGDGLTAVGMQLWQTVQIGAFEITAVPAVDWRGDDQVSWVVKRFEQQIFPGGDTIWHGSWWNIVKRFGGFDAVMLPVNGVVAQFLGIEPSHLPATLTPEQAPVAARLLKGKVLCSIHYGQFNNPPVHCDLLRIALMHHDGCMPPSGLGSNMCIVLFMSNGMTLSLCFSTAARCWAEVWATTEDVRSATEAKAAITLDFTDYLDECGERGRNGFSLGLRNRLKYFGEFRRPRGGEGCRGLLA